jgi:hypothetical protein
MYAEREMHCPPHCFQQCVQRYTYCFSLEDILGQKQDKGVMNLPSKKVRQLEGHLEEMKQQCQTMGIYQALIFILHGRCHILELVLEIFGSVVATKIGCKKLIIYVVLNSYIVLKLYLERVCKHKCWAHQVVFRCQSHETNLRSYSSN